MDKNRVKLSIVILSWNARELLKQCLESVIGEVGSASWRIGESELIVVDNGSTDGSVEITQNAKNKTPNDNLKFKIIENKENIGFTRGNNQGIKEAEGEYIMLLNSDTVVEKDSLEKLVNFLDENKEVAVVGPRLLNFDGSPQANCGRFPNLPVAFVMLFKEHFGGSDLVRCSPQKSCFVDWLMGAAFIARREVFDKVGGLDEELFMYMEEVEWFYRAKELGFKTYFLNEARIVHLGRGSSQTGKKEPILNIYRGLIHFYKKHKSWLELVILILLLKLKAVIAILIGYLRSDSYLKETYGEALKIN